MPNGALTLSDVYQPLNPLAVAAALETIKGARTQNRLAEMEATEKIKALARTPEFMKLLTKPEQQPQMPPEGFTGPMPAKMATPTNWSQMSPERQQGLTDIDPEKSWALMQAGQGRADKDREAMTAFYKEQAGEAFKTGNQELANSATAGMRQLGFDVADVKMSGPGNMKTQVTVGPDGNDPTGKPLIDPYTKQPKPPGVYDVEVGGGKVSILPAKDVGDADLKEFEQVTGTPAGSRGTPGYQGGFLKYQRGKKEATHISVNMPPVRDFKDERDMRKEFTALPEVKGFVEIESQMGRLDAAMQQSQRGGSKVAVDQALITILNKMLDPSSVVRESEYARTPADMGILNRLSGKLDKLNTGGAGLTDDERTAIASMARSFYGVAKQQYEAQTEFYTGLAKDYGYKPEHVVRLAGKKAGGGQAKARNLAPASSYLKKAKTEADGIARYEALQKQGWSDDEIDRAAKDAGWK